MPRKFGIVVLLVTLGLGVVALAQSDYDDGSVSYPNAIREGVADVLTSDRVLCAYQSGCYPNPQLLWCVCEPIGWYIGRVCCWWYVYSDFGPSCCTFSYHCYWIFCTPGDPVPMQLPAEID